MTKIVSLFPKYLLALALLFTLGCERDPEELQIAPFPNTAVVFDDGFTAGLNYAAFGGSKVDAFEVVTDESFAGQASMRIAVPDMGDPSGAYAGGVYFVDGGRNLTGYTTLSFWARASKAANLDLVGFGNDLGANRYQVAATNVAMTTNWQKYYIPIPDASVLTQERGMFFYSEGPEDGRGYTFWIDEVRFENNNEIAYTGPRIFSGLDSVATVETGATFAAAGDISFNLPSGINQIYQAASAYFTYTSSNPTVASVSPTGMVTVMDEGEAVITAKVGDLDAVGTLTITSTGDPVLPDVAAPAPTVGQDSVISLYSNAYEDEPVDFYNGFWEFS
ncbi:MAG: Ig-like domain-containing protein, partial [Bacteroidota bacterium]